MKAIKTYNNQMGGDILSGYTDYERGSLAMGAAALKAEQSNNVLGQQKSTTSYTHETNVFIGKCTSTNDNHHSTFKCRRRSICKQSG